MTERSFLFFLNNYIDVVYNINVDRRNYLQINMVMKTIFTALQKKIELLEENSQETFNLSEVEFHGFRLVYDEWCIPKNRKTLKKERLKKPHQTKQNKRSNYNKDTNKNKRRFK